MRVNVHAWNDVNEAKQKFEREYYNIRDEVYKVKVNYHYIIVFK
jgi:hypothetical protein